MKIPRPALLTGILLALLALVALAANRLPAHTPAHALSGPASQPTLPPPVSEVYVVRAYFDDYQMVHDLATWTEPWEVNAALGYVVLEVTDTELSLLPALGFRVEIDEDLTRALTAPRPLGPEIGVGGYPSIPGYACYRTVEGTFMTAEDLVTAYPTLAQWIDAGDSWEKTHDPALGYDMRVLILTNQNIPGPKPKLFATSSIHAREYTPAELMTRFAESLLAGYGTDPDATWILDYHEIHLMLLANPDGRKWAEQGYSWRKNTNAAYCFASTSRGADLNRNFSYQWGCCGGSSTNECATTYRGPSAASEPETQAIQTYLRAIFPDQRGPNPTDPAPADATGLYLDMHSYSKLVLWPWGFTLSPPANGTAIQTLGRKFAYFNHYTPSQSPNLYITDGDSIDFGYGDLGVASYTFELGNNFFEDCTYFENTILPDNLPALLYAAKVVRTPYLTPQGPDAFALTLSAATVPQGHPVTLTATLDDTRFNNSQGTEPSSPIAAAEYYLDTPPWIIPAPVAHPLAPAGGTFNTSIEVATATLDTTALPLGQHLLFVRGQDTGGHWGPITALFLTIAPPLAEETLTKTASVHHIQPGEIFTYTLAYEFEVTGSHTYTLHLQDELPAGITALPETLALNGLPAPELYNPATHAVELTQTGAVAGTHALILTFQARASYAPAGTQLANQFTTSLSIDGHPPTLHTSNAALLTFLPPSEPWLVLDKTASAPHVQPGGTLTYTLTAQLIFTGTHTYTLTLTDPLPTALTILPETILLDGVPAPWLYDPQTHALTTTLTGDFTSFAKIDIVFQAQINPDVPLGTSLPNTFTGIAWVDAQPAMYNGDATATIIVITPLYLPLLLR